MAYWQLYLSHFLSQFGDKLWSFAVPVLFATLWSDTLLPTTILNFILNALKVFLLPSVGRRIDTTDRLRFLCASLFGQNLCICASAMLLGLLGIRVRDSGAAFASSLQDTFLFVLLMAAGFFHDLFSSAARIGIQKDWVVVIAAGDEVVLTSLNTTLLRIDLFCKLVAPLGFGFLIDLPPTASEQLMLGVSIVFAWSAVSVFPIYWAWRSAYLCHADLQAIRPPRTQEDPCSLICRSSKAYCASPVFGASFAYCMLFFTILDGSSLTFAYLKQDGVSSAVLGLSRGGGAVTGILGTFLFPVLLHRFGLITASLIACWAFAICVVPISVLYLPVPVGALRGYSMLVAIVVSRTFLWCFELSNIQTMQQWVADGERGVLNATQFAMTQVIGLLMATIALFSADSFHILVFASAIGVGMAPIILTLWARRSTSVPHEGGSVDLSEPFPAAKTSETSRGG